MNGDQKLDVSGYRFSVTVAFGYG